MSEEVFDEPDTTFGELTRVLVIMGDSFALKKRFIRQIQYVTTIYRYEILLFRKTNSFEPIHGA